MTHCQPRTATGATVGHGLVRKTNNPQPNSKGSIVTKPLLKKFYFMSPVQVVKVTTHNIEQAATWCGGTIKTTESRRNPGRSDRYIDVPVPKGAALVMAFPGMFITKRVVINLENEIKVTYGVFRKDFFEKNYWAEPLESVDACWTRLENEEIKPEPIVGFEQNNVTMNIHVANPGDIGKAMEAARKKLLENKDVAEVNVINALNGDELVTEIVGEPQLPGDLTPVQQRALITEDGVEEGVVPETANVVLPSYAAAKHPSLRDKIETTNRERKDLVERLEDAAEKIDAEPDAQLLSGANPEAFVKTLEEGDPHRA